MKRSILFLMIMVMMCSGCASSAQNDDIQKPLDSTKNTQLYIQDLIIANQMTALCSAYDTVRIEQTMGEIYSTDDYTLYQNVLSNIYTSYYDQKMQSQTFHIGYFSGHIIENQVEAYFYIEQALSEEPWINHETVLSRYFENTVIDIINEDELTWTLFVQQTSDSSYEIIVDKTSLAIQSITAGPDGQLHIQVHYGVNIEGMQLIEALQGPYKKVEIAADVYNENTAIHFDQIFSVPLCWELQPACLDLYSLYSDASCEAEYFYPGDGMDYSVYLSNTRG